MATKTKSGEPDAPAPVAPRAAEEGMGGELDKVRSILFGEQIRAYETRLRQIEAAFAGQIGALREEMADRFGSVDQVLNAMMTRIEEHMAKDRLANADRDADRQADIAGLQERLDAAERAFADRMQTLEQEYRASLAARADALMATLHTQVEALTQQAQSAQARLDSDKVDRRQLASFMNQLADQLNGAGA